MRVLRALIRKEALQIIRDPSAISIAFVLPLILLFIFGYGVNLDSNKVSIGLVLEQRNPDINSLAAAFTGSRFLDVRVANDRREFADDLISGHLRGMVIVPQNFSKQAMLNGSAKIQVIADGSEPNIASFVQNYSSGIVQSWLGHQKEDRGIITLGSLIQIKSRFWYNSELKSRNFLIPGSIAIIMAMIGTLLTALVISREWERGTMEAMMATPVSIKQILLGKLIPYFILGLGSMIICTLVATVIYGVPFRGSFFMLLIVTAVFLVGALGQGLLISTIAKDQFLAAQIALISAFLPAFMLSGFIFEISSMPKPIQWLTSVFLAKYFVTSLQALFLVGNIWPLFLNCIGAMAIIGLVFFLITAKKTKKRLD
jgi:ABC-2 type transport system permease protein